MWTTQWHAAALFRLGSLVFRLMFAVISHNRLLMLSSGARGAITPSRFTLAAYLFALSCSRLGTIALASIVCTTSPR